MKTRLLKIIDYFRTRYYNKKIKRGVYVLNRLDDWMHVAGYKRHERRQFWREFTTKQGAREKLFDRLGK
jgi:hypothetical protein